MDYPGVTTTEPTIFHLIVFYVAVIIISYPTSVLLILTGIISRRENEGVIRRANKITKAQFLPAILAWIIGTIGGYILFFILTLAGGLLAAINIIKPVDSLEGPLIILFIISHLATQVYAYKYAIEETSPNSK